VVVVMVATPYVAARGKAKLYAIAILVPRALPGRHPPARRRPHPRRAEIASGSLQSTTFWRVNSEFPEVVFPPGSLRK
jgi:hypothetical protein